MSLFSTETQMKGEKQKMKAWETKLNKFLDGDLKLFEEDYKITYPCIIKRNGKRIKAKIDIENGIVYGADGQVIRKCKGV